MAPQNNIQDMGTQQESLQARAYKTAASPSSVLGMLGSASSMMGSFSSLYEKKETDQCEGISLALLLTTFAGIAVTFFAVFTKLTMLGKRKKRSVDGEDDSPMSALVENFQQFAQEGTRVVDFPDDAPYRERDVTMVTDFKLKKLLV